MKMPELSVKFRQFQLKSNLANLVPNHTLQVYSNLELTEIFEMNFPEFSNSSSELELAI